MDSVKLLNRLPRAIVQQPFECLIALLFIVSGSTILCGWGGSSALKQLDTLSFGALPEIWAVLSIASALIIVVGIHAAASSKDIARTIMGHTLEKSGLTLQATTCMFYGGALILVFGAISAVSAGMMFAIVLVNIVRTLLLNASIKLLRQTADEMRGVAE